VSETGARKWKYISTEFFDSSRSDIQCLHRWKKVLQPGLVKGPWEKKEDDIILHCMKNGTNKWCDVAARINGRSAKQCRERWNSILNPDTYRGKWSETEVEMLIVVQARVGNKWSAISKSGMLAGRSANSIKNKWYSSKREEVQTLLGLNITDKNGNIIENNPDHDENWEKKFLQLDDKSINAWNSLNGSDDWNGLDGSWIESVFCDKSDDLDSILGDIFGDDNTLT
jgi:myb proto-oncogene protein